MNKKSFLFLIVLCVLVFTQVSCAPRPLLHESRNLVIRSNNQTSLEEALINIKISDLNPADERMNGLYLKYNETFEGNFTLHNAGDSHERIVVTYPFRQNYLTTEYLNRAYYLYGPLGRYKLMPLNNFEIVINNQPFYDYEYVTTPQVTGSRKPNDEFECQKNCDRINNSYSCECDDRGVTSTPRWVCDPTCKKIICESDNSSIYCHKCDTAECLMPFGTDLGEMEMVKFVLDFIPQETKTIQIKYDTIGNGAITHVMQDSLSWTTPIMNETLVFEIERGECIFETDFVKSHLTEQYTVGSTSIYVFEFLNFLPKGRTPYQNTYKYEIYCWFKRQPFNLLPFEWLGVILVFSIPLVAYLVYKYGGEIMMGKSSRRTLAMNLFSITFGLLLAWVLLSIDVEWLSNILSFVRLSLPFMLLFLAIKNRAHIRKYVKPNKTKNIIFLIFVVLVLSKLLLDIPLRYVLDTTPLYVLIGDIGFVSFYLLLFDQYVFTHEMWVLIPALLISPIYLWIETIILSETWDYPHNFFLAFISILIFNMGRLFF